MDQFWEIFTLLTGILYIVLEIRQHNFMWVVGILTALAAMWVFWQQKLFASVALNGYYFVISFIGLRQWRKVKGEYVEDGGDTASSIVIRPLGLKTVLFSLLIFIIGILAFGFLVGKLGDPMSHLDVAVAVLSAIATWWLARAYAEQWLLWIFADGLSTFLCIRAAQAGSDGMWWMVALYAAYTVAAVYGYYHWRVNGSQKKCKKV